MNKLTKRILIANDVIISVRNKHIVPSHNGTIDSQTRYEITKLIRDGFKLQDAIPQVTCETCAKGAILCEFITRFNSVDSLDNIVSEVMTEKVPQLTTVFTIKQLNEMEFLFEGNSYTWHRPYWTDSQYDKMQKFYAKYTTAEKRLIAIMQLIINNDGKKILF